VKKQLTGAGCTIVSDRRMRVLQIVGYAAIGLLGLIVLGVVVAVVLFSFTGSKYVQSKQDTKDE
jgi:hypothetical protein